MSEDKYLVRMPLLGPQQQVKGYKLAWQKKENSSGLPEEGDLDQLLALIAERASGSPLGFELVGGLYGLAMGRAFFGESMFSRATNASKVALAWLVARMKIGGFVLLDCQFMTDHLASLGAVEISQQRYLVLLEAALGRDLQASVGSSSGASSAVGSAGAGDWGALEGFLAAGAGVPLEGFASTASSSPGKLILQLLTQTS